MNDFQRSALRFVERGAAVVPLWPVRGERPLVCACGESCGLVGLHPMLRRNRALRHEPAIREHWRHYPLSGVAIATGQASGIWVLEASDKRGRENLVELETVHGALPLGPRSLTGNGVVQRWFRAPARRVPSFMLRTGLVLRADTGLVVAPPTRTASTRATVWLPVGTECPTTAPFPSVPAWLDRIIERDYRMGVAA